jgi:WD40 repeat protein
VDVIKAFRVFVAKNTAPLHYHSAREGFVAQLARNDAPAGPVHQVGKRALENLSCIKFDCLFPPEETYNPLPACIAVLEGHMAPVTSVALSADGRRLISGSDDTTLRVWDTGSGECLRVLEGHTSEIKHIAAAADGRRVVSATGHTGDFDEVTAQDDTSVRVWDADSGECLHVLKGHATKVALLAISADGHRVVSADRPVISDVTYNLVYHSTLRVWDTDSGECIHILEGQTGEAMCLAITPDGRRIISAYKDIDGNDATLRIWDIDSGECIHVLEGIGDVSSFALNSDALRLASGAYMGSTVTVWDIESKTCVQTFAHEKNIQGREVSRLALTADARCVVSWISSEEGNAWFGRGERDCNASTSAIAVWDIETGRCLFVLENSIPLPTGWDIRPLLTTNDRFVVVGEQLRVRIWDIKSGKSLQTLEGHTGHINSLVLSADGRHLVSVSDDCTIRVWNIENSKRQTPATDGGRPCEVNHLSLSYDGQRVISVGRETKSVRILDVKSGRRLDAFTESIETLARGEKGFSAQQFSLNANGSRVIWGTVRDRTLRVWDFESGNCLTVLEGQSGLPNAVAFSHDGRTAVVGNRENPHLWIWNIVEGKCIQVLHGHDDWASIPPSRFSRLGVVNSLDLSSDGYRAISGSNDKTRIWDIKSGECLHVLHGHENAVISVVLSADGQRAVSGSYDSIRIWDVSSGACLRILHGTDGRLSLSNDGSKIMSRVGDNILIWDIESGELLAVCFARGLASFVCAWGQRKIIASFPDGSVKTYRLENLPLGPFITTAHREILSEDLPSGPIKARPSCCGQLIAIPDLIIDRIDHWALHGGEEGYTDSTLLLPCPSCGTLLRMNPFFFDVRTE